MLAEINHLPCKGIYFLLYTWREMGRELNFLSEWNNFLFNCHHLLCSIPALKDNGQLSVDLGCPFCLKNERVGNLLTWL